MRKFVCLSVAFVVLSISGCKKDEEELYSQLQNEIIGGKGGGNNTTFQLGQIYGGGYVFYIDITGQHGLIAAEKHLNLLRWGIDNPSKATGATGTIDGAANTKKIIQVYGNTPNYSSPYAAKARKDYRGGGYTDWYLPAINELLLLYQNRTYVPGFTTNYGYWTSTEESFILNSPNPNYSRVHYLDALYGGGIYVWPSFEGCLVMPIRKF